MPEPPARRSVPSSAIASFIDRARIDRLLAPWVPSDADRAFVVRCLLDEGPVHHRGANFVLLALLEELMATVGATPAEAAAAGDARAVAVPMRLPPHLSQAAEDGVFPLRMPTRALERLAPAESVGFAAMIECLTDGPPQHALGNAAMVCLLSALLSHLERRTP